MKSNPGERLYHVVVRNDKTGQDTYMTGYPMTHRECTVMKSKMTPDSKRAPHLRTMLVEATPASNRYAVAGSGLAHAGGVRKSARRPNPHGGAPPLHGAKLAWMPWSLPGAYGPFVGWQIIAADGTQHVMQAGDTLAGTKWVYQFAPHVGSRFTHSTAGKVPYIKVLRHAEAKVAEHGGPQAARNPTGFRKVSGKRSNPGDKVGAPSDWTPTSKGYALKRPHGFYEWDGKHVRYWNRTVSRSGIPSSVFTGVNDFVTAKKKVRSHDREMTRNMAAGEAWTKAHKVNGKSKQNPAAPKRAAPLDPVVLARLPAATLAERASRAGWHSNTTAGHKRLVAYVAEMKRRLGRDPGDYFSTLRAFYDEFVPKQNPMATAKNPRRNTAAYSETITHKDQTYHVVAKGLEGLAAIDLATQHVGAIKVHQPNGEWWVYVPGWKNPAGSTDKPPTDPKRWTLMQSYGGRTKSHAWLTLSGWRYDVYPRDGSYLLSIRPPFGPTGDGVAFPASTTHRSLKAATAAAAKHYQGVKRHNPRRRKNPIAGYPPGTAVGAGRWPYGTGTAWKGKVLSDDDPRAWTDTLAFQGRPTRAQTRAHLDWIHKQGRTMEGKAPVLWDFGDYKRVWWEQGPPRKTGVNAIKPYAEDRRLQLAAQAEEQEQRARTTAAWKAREAERQAARANPKHKGCRKNPYDMGAPQQVQQVPKGYVRIYSADRFTTQAEAQRAGWEFSQQTFRPVALVYVPSIKRKTANPWAVYAAKGW